MKRGKNLYSFYRRWIGGGDGGDKAEEHVNEGDGRRV